MKKFKQDRIINITIALSAFWESQKNNTTKTKKNKHNNSGAFWESKKIIQQNAKKHKAYLHNKEQELEHFQLRNKKITDTSVILYVLQMMIW